MSIKTIFIENEYDYECEYESGSRSGTEMLYFIYLP